MIKEFIYVILTNGTKIWYNSNGDIHRDDGPAIEFPSGVREWYYNGKRHRVNGPAIEWNDESSSEDWYIHGKLHREGGPAVTRKQGKYWYKNNLLHREDGPAIEYPNGLCSYYLNNEKIYVTETTFD